MKKDNFENYIRGWMIGSFQPTLLNTTEFEFSIKKYVAGDFESKHHHKIATEYTFIIIGKVLMNNVEYKANDVVIIEPGESCDFTALEYTITAVIKYPGAQNDKYIDQ